MQHIFVKKNAQGGVDFALTSDDICNNCAKPLDEFNAEESSIQVIGNGDYHVIYPSMGCIETAYLKMMFNDELKDRPTLTIQEIREEFVQKIKDELKSCKRLFTEKTDEYEKLSMSGGIIIINRDKLFFVDGRFFPIEIDEWYDWENVSVMAIRDYMNPKSLHELFDKFKESWEKRGVTMDYPLIYGNSLEEKITIEHLNGEEKSLDREVFKCRW